MKRITKVISLLLSLTLCAACLTACGTGTTSSAKENTASAETSASEAASDSASTAEAADKMYVGVVCYLTGPNMAEGVNVKKGMDLIVEKINASGGILGAEVVPVYFDGIDSVQTTINAVKLALADERLSCLIVSCFSASALAVMPYIEEAGMPTLVTGSSDLITAENNPYIWQNRPVDSAGAIALAKFAAEELKVSKPAIWHATLDNYVALKDNVIKNFANHGITVADNMIFSTEDSEMNYAPIAAQIKASGADSLLCFGNPLPMALVAKALQDAGCDIPVLGNQVIPAKVCVENAGDAIEGWYTYVDYIPSDPRAEVQEFVVAYEEAYSELPDNTSVRAWDMLSIFKAAAENAGTVTDREAINNAMAEISGLSGVLGIYNSFEDHTMLDTVVFGQMKSGVPTYVASVKFK